VDGSARWLRSKVWVNFLPEIEGRNLLEAAIVRQHRQQILSLSMASVKIAIPLGGRDSKAFRDALKVTIAARAYNANVKWAKGTG